MYIKKTSSGSVVVFALMILSIIVLLTEQLIRGVYVGSNFTKTMIDREHAEMLALGGVNLAIAQLTLDKESTQSEEKTSDQAASEPHVEGEEKEGSGQGDKKDADKILKKMLARVLPHLNRWQAFNLDEKLGEIDGQIKICITCESGKINLNEAFDFKKQEFKKEFDVLLKGLEIPGKMPAGEIYKTLTEFFKNRKRKLDDISELSGIKSFNQLDLFYRPPASASKGKKSEPNGMIALQDLFTLWTANEKIDPLWFSDALCAVAMVRRPCGDDAQRRKEQNKQFIDAFKKEWAQDWAANWKQLEPVYEQSPKLLEQIKKIFSQEFGPKVFSVLSCGKVGNVEQQLLAIIKEVDEANIVRKTDKEQEEKEKEHAQGAQESKDKKPGESKKFFKIVRLYWI